MSVILCNYLVSLNPSSHVCCHNSRAWLIVVYFQSYFHMVANIYTPALAFQQCTNQRELVSPCTVFSHHSSYIHQMLHLIRFVSLTYDYLSDDIAQDSVMMTNYCSPPQSIPLFSSCKSPASHADNKLQQRWKHSKAIKNIRQQLWQLRPLHSFDIGCCLSIVWISYCCHYYPDSDSVDELLPVSVQLWYLMDILCVHIYIVIMMVIVWDVLCPPQQKYSYIFVYGRMTMDVEIKEERRDRKNMTMKKDDIKLLLNKGKRGRKEKGKFNKSQNV